MPKKISNRKNAPKLKNKKKASQRKTAKPKKTVKQKQIHRLKITVIALAIFSVVIFVAFAVLLWQVISFNRLIAKNVGAPVVPVAARSATNVSTLKNIGLPVRIIIPSINLDSTIEKVGLKSDGSMDVPKDPMNTGWYDLGVRPGEIGSAVMDGHVDWWYGAPAVFPNLYKVKTGDKIIVEDEFGSYMSFVVRRIQSYGATADATSVFTSNDGKAHLNLITCTGAWDYGTNQYSNRLVVFADKE